MTLPTRTTDWLPFVDFVCFSSWPLLLTQKRRQLPAFLGTCWVGFSPYSERAKPFPCSPTALCREGKPQDHFTSSIHIFVLWPILLVSVHTMLFLTIGAHLLRAKENDERETTLASSDFRSRHSSAAAAAS